MRRAHASVPSTGLEDGSVRPIEQDHTLATLAPILTREDGFIDFTRTAHENINRWRGFTPWPGAHTTLRGKKLIVHHMTAADRTLAPATLDIDAGRLFAGCNTGSLELLEVQMEGKKRMPAAEFLRGFQLKSGERLGA